MSEQYERCAICGRELIPGKNINAHHLIPKTFKGKETITIHVICHTKIHSVFSERELFQYYHTPERIRNHPEMEKFIKWVRKQPPNFRVRHKQYKGRKKPWNKKR